MSNCTVHTLLQDNTLLESNLENASLIQISFHDFIGTVNLHEGERVKDWMEVMKGRGERNLIRFKLFARFLLWIFEPTRKEYLGSVSYSFNHKRVFILEQ